MPRDPQQTIEEVLANLPPEGLTALIAQLGAAGPRGVDEAPVPSRRRPRRSDLVTYRVRIELADTAPPLWRRLELSSDLFLDELHAVIQIAFGWTDSHLHQFGSGPRYYDRRTEYYLCPFQAEQGGPGIPEEHVRLDEVLVDVGDILHYCYDFGDDWQHVVSLEAVLPHQPGAPRARCTDGRRPGPPEDCGGVGGYELVVAAIDPAHSDHAMAVIEYREMYGEDIDTDYYAPVPFDPDAINENLAEIDTPTPALRPAGPGDSAEADLPELMRDVVTLMRTMPLAAQNHVRQMINRIPLDAPPHIDEAVAAPAVRPYTVLLEHIGTDGATLTAAGYLPPAVVAAVFDELRMDERWIGKGNREDLTPPVALLRESAQRMGLVRKYRGKLLPTPKGRALVNNPIGLWSHLAAKTATQIGKYGEETPLLYLITIAAGVTEGVENTVAEILTAADWTRADGSPLNGRDLTSMTRSLNDVFERMNLTLRERDTFERRFSPEAIEFARSILWETPTATR
ncbi:plasmid pRiA4b ORF-3 family protein [Nocardia sp. NPDC101769]|uniref:plasmid pRiA4b ORF-3 family protein n=1 Tax=Nocardia sp. NPDC101769 TaxID=3364333 RepID=UPI0038286D5E